MEEVTQDDLDFLVGSTYIARWGSRMLQETTLCVMSVGVVATKAGMYRGRQYASGDTLHYLSESNHGLGSWYPSASELRLPKGVKLSEDMQNIVYAEH